MVSIVGVVDCGEVAVEIDFYTSLTVEWYPASPGPSTSIDFEGINGGDFALDMDDETGRLRRATLLIDPPLDEDLVMRADVPERTGRVLVDLSVFSGQPSYLSKVNVSALLRYRDTGTHILVAVSNADIAEYVSCGGVRVGVSGQGEIVCVEAPKPDAVSLSH